jgi:uncharacterized protein involved in exopolysaccharide biosynthesis/Mrp family chromosome partitioning ATPase
VIVADVADLNLWVTMFLYRVPDLGSGRMDEDASSEVGARRRGGGILARWKMLVLVPAAAAALAYGTVGLVGPRYHGEARLLLDADGGASVEAMLSGQAEIISSPALLKKAAQALHLERTPAPEAKGLVARLRHMIGMGGAATTLRDGIEIVPAGARMLAIRMSSADAGLAVAAPNALADSYLALLDAARLEPGPAAGDPALAGLADAVKTAEENVAQARAAGAGRAETESALAAAERRLDAAREAAAEARSAVSALEAVGRGGVSSDGLPDHPAADALRGLIEQRAEARARVDELSRTLLGNHPDMRAAKADLARVDASLKSAARQALATLRAEADARGNEENRLSAEHDRLKAEAARKAGAAQTLGALDAALAQARARFDAELTRYHPAGGRYLAAKARLIARATVPVQSPLSRPLPVSLAVFAATLLSMTLLALVQSRVQGAADRRAFRQAAMPIDEVAMPVSPGDGADVPEMAPQAAGLDPAVEAAVVRAEAERPIVLPARVGTPWFAAASAGRKDRSGAPRLPKAKKSFLLQGGRAPMQHAQHMGRMGELDADAAARRFISGTSTRAIFVSPEGDEAAAVAILTARAIADAGLRVLLLDLTASGAASRPMLESASVAGITDLLVREAQFTDAIHQDHFSDCHVIPVGMADPNRAMRAADRLPVIIDSLTAAYDIVVVECGPADAESIRGLVSDDSEVVVSLLDAEDDVAREADALIAAGYERTMVVAPGGRDHLATFSREAIRDRWLADNGAEA